MFLKLEWKSVLAATYFWVWKSYTGMHLCFCFSLRTNPIAPTSVRKTFYVLFLYQIFFYHNGGVLCFRFELLHVFSAEHFPLQLIFAVLFLFQISHNESFGQLSDKMFCLQVSFFSNVCPLGSFVENSYRLGLWCLTLIITCAFVVVIRPVLIQ